MTQYRFLATSPKGLGSLLVPEMSELGALDVRETVAGVTFKGDWVSGTAPVSTAA